MDLGMSDQMLSPDNFQNLRNSKPQKEFSLTLISLHGMLTWEIESLVKKKSVNQNQILELDHTIDSLRCLVGLHKTIMLKNMCLLFQVQTYLHSSSNSLCASWTLLVKTTRVNLLVLSVNCPLDTIQTWYHWSIPGKSKFSSSWLCSSLFAL